MAQHHHLSNREQEVVHLLLEGKSNKLIAASLGISESTVEFHLKRIYAKFQVASRMELVLKLGQSTGAVRGESARLGQSIVAEDGKVAENRDRPSLRDRVISFMDAVSRIGKEKKMETNARDETGMMTFFGSIHVCFTKYADFNGRATRAEFWWFTLFVTLAAAALAYLNESLTNVFLVATLLPFLAAGSRRLHDIGKSGWWQLFLLVPIGGFVLLGSLWAKPTNDTPSA